ncbi:YndM family protein [Paenisporosarcina indica]|uniref:YndM family protein n=1 Tax=Paenisporosarcina indica TaxID=650093 RepID=UPI00094F560B|nr:YndM family protein [Paenisporosarcina indica]
MKSFLIKWIMVLAVLWIVLGWFYGVSFTDILFTSVVLTVVAYVADVYILPRVGNVFAAILDFILAMAVIWFMGSFLFEGPIALGTASFISAIIITIGELMFHRYMKNQVFDKEPERTETDSTYYGRPSNLQTEFGSEIDVDAAKKASEQGRNDDNIQSSNLRNEFGSEVEIVEVKRPKNKNQPSTKNKNKRKKK